MQVLLHMLQSGRTYDSTAFMAGVLAAGRRGAWAVGEMMLLAAFRGRFQLARLSALPPPELSDMPDAFHEVRSCCVGSSRPCVALSVPLH
jgi:hypothetical protein